MLRALGLSEHTFSEIILIVIIDKRINATPIGIKLINNGIEATIFKNSITYLGLINSKECTINITSDARIFYKLVMNEELNANELIPSEMINTPALKSADAIIEAKVINVIDKMDRATFHLTPINVRVLNSIPRAFNRAHPAIIEALVHYTRIEPYITMNLLNDVDKLIERIKICINTVQHSTKDPELITIANDILNKAIKIKQNKLTIK